MVKLPVAVAHVGWVTALSVGTAGAAGWASITAAAEAAESQPLAVALIVYLPSGAVTELHFCVTHIDGFTV